MCIRVRAHLVGGRAVLGQRVQRADDRCGGARTPEDRPSAGVHPYAGVGIRHRGHVADRAPAALGVDLPGGLGLERAATAPRTAPHSLRRVASSGVRGLEQARTTDRDDCGRSRGIVHAVAAVAGAGDDRDARVVEERGVGLQLAGPLCAAVAVAHGARTERDRPVHRGAEVHERRVGCLHQQDLAVGAQRADHVDVERDLLLPRRVGRRIVGSAGLVDLPEAAIRGGARRQAEMRAVGREVALGVRRVESVDDPDGPAGAARRRRRVVCRLEVRGVIPAVVADHIVGGHIVGGHVVGAHGAGHEPLARVAMREAGCNRGRAQVHVDLAVIPEMGTEAGRARRRGSRGGRADPCQQESRHSYDDHGSCDAPNHSRPSPPAPGQCWHTELPRSAGRSR